MAVRWIWLAVALVACRGREAPAPSPTSAPSAEPAAHAPAVRPALPGIDAAVAPPANQQEAFAAEPIDATWKAQTETQLRAKLARLPGGPPALDCRTTTCLVTVTASEHDLRAAVDELGGLRAIAQNMILTAPEPAGDGKLALHAYVQFER